MYFVQLKFSTQKSKAGAFMEGHNDWLKQGFDDGVFLLAGSLQPGLGGAILAHGGSLSDLEARLQQDPFVREDVVRVEIAELDPKKADDRLSFLLAG